MLLFYATEFEMKVTEADLVIDIIKAILKAPLYDEESGKAF